MTTEERDGDRAGWVVSPGGLVAALAPAVRRSQSTWVGWTGEVGDAPPPFERDGIGLLPVALNADDVDSYYAGFCNSTLWPLYHDAIFVPMFHRHWWDAYRRVNERFADAVAAAAPTNAMVWVHDYHLQLVPMMLREKRSDLHIGFFLHIPFPSHEMFFRLPWRALILRGLLGADVVGFQTRAGAGNFRRGAERLLGAKIERGGVCWGDRHVRVEHFPVGIDYDGVHTGAGSEATKDRARQIRQELGDPEILMLGVDRLDYTKGIDVRLRAISELFAEGRLKPSTCVLVQIAEPSRDATPGYAEMGEIVNRLVGEINGNFQTMERTVVKYLHQSQPTEELLALYSAADVMLVTPFRDGMNLVAKEFVAAQVDDPGVLVLSEFAGAAHELGRARLVNPYDIDGMKDVIVAASQAPLSTRRADIEAMQKVVSRNDAERWGERFLAGLRGSTEP